MIKLSNILLVLFLILFPSGELLRIKIYQNAHIVPQDIVAFLLFLIVIYFFISGKKRPIFKEFYLLQVSFIAFGVVSLVINSFFNPEYNFFVSILYAVRYLVYLSILFYPKIISEKINVNKILLYSGGITVAIGYLQFFFYNNLRNLFYLGWDEHLYRLFSTFLDPNFAGVFFVLYISFITARICEIKKWKKAFPEITLFVLTLIAIYLTYSRSALISLLTFIVVFLISLKKAKAIFIAMPILLFFLVIFSDFSVEGLNPLRTASTSQRIKSLSEAATIIKDNSIIGVGFNSFRYAQVKYGIRHSVGSATSNADAGTDNSLLFVLATTGVIGLTLFIYGYYHLLKAVLNSGNTRDKAYFAGLIAIIAGSMFVNVLFYIPIMSFLWLMLAFRKNDVKVTS